MRSDDLQGKAGQAAAGEGFAAAAVQALRLARRELRGGLAGFRVFLLCLALGVAAIAAVTSVRDAIGDGLRREGATMLGGDAEIRLTWRTATAPERAFMAGRAEVSEVVEFRSLAVAGDERGLTQVKGVDAAWPLLGAPRLDPPMPLEAALAGQDGRPGALMDPLLIARLGIAPGAVFRLGAQEFVLMAALLREPDGSGAFLLGPRTLVRSADLAGSGLLAEGTMFDASYRMLVPPGTDLGQMEQAAAAAMGGGGYRWRDARRGQPGTERMVDRLAAFLILTGLAGLAVGGVGISSAVRSYLAGRRPTIATLKVLGASSRVIFLTYAFQIGLLAGLGILIGLGIGAALPLIALPQIEAQLGVPAGSALQPAALAEAALYGALSATLFTLWPLAGAARVRAAALWRDAALGRGHWPRGGWLLVLAVLLALLVGSAAWLTGAAAITLWTALALGLAFLALIGAASLVSRLARRLARAQALRGRSTLRLALSAVGGSGGEALPVVLALGLGLTVLAAVGQIDANLRGALAEELPERAPAFFVVDIQPDQITPFLERLQSDPEVSEVASAPMLRGVITRINGRPATEVAGEHWVLRGDRGVTYADRPPQGTRITEGRWWPEDYTGPPQVSFGASEGAALGLKLGDRIGVNILGREIEADITSFREVDFSTGGIGFVLTMNPGALAGAPHSHIATVEAGAAAEGRLLRELSQAWPNITVIPVREVIGRAAELVSAVASAVTLGALATLVTGAVVLVGTAAASERARVYEAAVLKVLGASRREILSNFALRSALLGAAAALVAICAGALSAWAVCRFVLETGFSFAPVPALVIVLGGVLVTLITGLGFALRPLAVPPARVLRGQE